jgi:hypothetical protein
MGLDAAERRWALKPFATSMSATALPVPSSSKTIGICSGLQEALLPWRWRFTRDVIISATLTSRSKIFVGFIVLLSDPQSTTEREEAFQREARAVYEERLGAGVAREQARKDLPLSTYTAAYWKIHLHNLLHFLSLRMHSHAQQEIREYANVIGHEIVKRWCPLAWEAFEDYCLGALFLTRAETTIAAALIKRDAGAASAVAVENGMLDTEDRPIERSRERAELEEKFRTLGIKPPWA